MPHQFTASYVQESLAVFRLYKQLAERAMEQCPDAGLFTTLDPESNSIAIIVKHMAGNMRSRWENFLTSDGEKPDRHRDGEFEAPPQSRAAMMAVWERGWKYVFDAIEPLTEADLARTVTIRQEPHSVLQAIDRQVGHYSYHVGQIILLAKHEAALAGRWKAVTIPRGQSGSFNRDVAAGAKSQR